jgi:hypothetical protein
MNKKLFYILIGVIFLQTILILRLDTKVRYMTAGLKELGELILTGNKVVDDQRNKCPGCDVKLPNKCFGFEKENPNSHWEVQKHGACAGRLIRECDEGFVRDLENTEIGDLICVEISYSPPPYMPSICGGPYDPPCPGVPDKQPKKHEIVTDEWQRCESDDDCTIAYYNPNCCPCFGRDHAINRKYLNEFRKKYPTCEGRGPQICPMIYCAPEPDHIVWEAVCTNNRCEIVQIN